MRAIFLSDLHLKNMDESSSQKLLFFLRDLQNELPTHIFLVGDIFDLWIRDHQVFIGEFYPIIEALEKLKEKGVEIHYFEGNHDLYLRPFWQNKLGFQVHSKRFYKRLGDKWFRIEHGDQMNPSDKGYLFLRKLLRTPAVRILAKNLPGLVVNQIGNVASKKSRKYTSTAKKVDSQQSVNLIRKHAKVAFKESPFDFIISGHVHVRDDFEFENNGKEVRSINLGSWFDEQKVLVWDSKDFYWQTLK